MLRHTVAQVNWLGEPVEIVVEAPVELASVADPLTAAMADGYRGASAAVGRPPTSFGLRLEHRDDGITIAVVCAGEVIDRADDPAIAVALALWCATQLTLERCRVLGLTALHAAAVASADHTVVIAGASGSGKSTLAGALVAAGAGLIGDEVAAVTPLGGLEPVPRPLLLSAPSCTGLGLAGPVFGPERAVGPGLLGAAWAPAPQAGTVTVVLPHFREGAALQVDLLGRAETVCELARSCFDFTQRPQESLGALAALARRGRTVRLTYGNASAAAAWILAGAPQ